MLGYSAIGLPNYVFGVFVPSVEREFGWTRAQLMSGFSISSLTGAGFYVLVGMVRDRIGSRPIALIGQLGICGAFAFLSLSNGTVLDWTIHWMLIGLSTALLQGPVWTAPVANVFIAGRGLAMAAVLAGATITASLGPFLAGAFMSRFDWRYSVAAVGLSWLAATLPFTLFLFFDKDRAKASKD